MTRQARVRPEDLNSLCREILRAGGVDEVQLADVADNLSWNDLVGRQNFGVLRLPVYLERVNLGGVRCPCTPVVSTQGDAVAVLDGDGGFGQHAARIASDHVIALAGASGVGAVGVRNSNFFGTGAYFVHRIAQAGMVGVAMSNSFPKVVAHGGRSPVFGTNPFAFGAPRANGESIMFDMATSALAGSTVRASIDAGTPLSPDMALDASGEPTTDPRDVATGALLPVAGAKGYGLALMVEILAGVMTGAAVSRDIGSMYAALETPGNNGHFLVAFDISRFMAMEDFDARLEALVGLIKASNPNADVRLPGEIRWRNYRDNMRDGVQLEPSTRAALDTACQMTGVTADLPSI